MASLRAGARVVKAPHVERAVAGLEEDARRETERAILASIGAMRLGEDALWLVHGVAALLRGVDVDAANLRGILFPLAAMRMAAADPRTTAALLDAIRAEGEA